MKKKKALYHFLFSTDDLDFDPNRIEVTDTETGQKYEVQVHMVKNKKKKLTKIFSLRLADSEINEIKDVAEEMDLTPAHFARRVLREAIQENKDEQRLAKNKR